MGPGDLLVPHDIPRSACGDVLDTFKTDKYEILVDDAFKWLATYK